MPSFTLSIRSILATVAWISATHAWAAQNPEKLAPAQYSAEVGLGAEYDSNVSVVEVDRSSNQGDNALTIDASLEVQKEVSKTVEVAATYDFSQSVYDEFSEVDRQTHILGTDLLVNLEKIDTGVSLYYINSRLDNEKFLELYRVSSGLQISLQRPANLQRSEGTEQTADERLLRLQSSSQP